MAAAQSQLEALRKEPLTRALPVILLAPAHEAAQLASLIADPHTLFLSKPLRRRRLKDAILTVLGLVEDSSVMPPLTALEPLPGSAGHRILIADDNAMNQRVAQAMVQALGIPSDVVPSGSQALEALERGAYDLILLDCNMPGMDGFETTTEIRKRALKDRRGQRLPVIALTASAMGGTREKCLAAGMDDYLVKPLRPEALRTALVAWLPTTTLESSLEGAALSALGRLDPNANDGWVASLIHEYLDDAPKRLLALREALRMQDAVLATRQLHNLKSNSGTVGAIVLTALCAELELAAQAGDLATIEIRMEELEREWRRVAADLKGRM